MKKSPCIPHCKRWDEGDFLPAFFLCPETYLFPMNQKSSVRTTLMRMLVARGK